MKILVLVPTYNKTKENIFGLFDKLNIKTDVVFSNQCGFVGDETVEYKNHKIKIISSNTKGVSANRNILAQYADGDLNVCIDDDCPLVENYEQIIECFFANHKCDCVLFNGVWKTHENKLVHSKKTKKVSKFIDISYGGGPGFVFKRGLFEKFNLKYNENIGTPNYICAGEDSLFYFNLSKSKAVSYRSSEVLFIVAEDVDNSSYFSGINEQYVVTRGYVLAIVHSKLFLLYALKHTLRFKKQTNIKFLTIFNWIRKGRKLYKNEN